MKQVIEDIKPNKDLMTLAWVRCNVCSKEVLVHLENNAYDSQKIKAGKYTLQPFKENGICYWKQDDGTNGLWFVNESNFWIIGLLDLTLSPKIVWVLSSLEPGCSIS